MPLNILTSLKEQHTMANQRKILEIKTYPDPILRKKCLKINKITAKEVELFEDMLFTMHASSGVGLAASQVGYSLQILVADAGDGDGPIKLANPRIVEVKGADKFSEGCLSVPELNVEIERPYEIIVEGLNELGKQVRIEASGLMARVIQHEMDHLNGKLIVDYLGFIGKIKAGLRSRRRK